MPPIGEAEPEPMQHSTGGPPPDPTMWSRPDEPGAEDSGVSGGTEKKSRRSSGSVSSKASKSSRRSAKPKAKEPPPKPPKPAFTQEQVGGGAVETGLAR